MKFGALTHIGPLPQTDRLNFELLKTVKSPYLWNFSTDFDKIWHGDAYWFPEAGAKLRFSFRTIFMAVFQIKELLKYILHNYKYQNL